MKSATHRLSACLALLIACTSCDSTSPGAVATAVRVEGSVRESGVYLNGAVPSPSLSVTVTAWPEPGAGGADSAVVQTDAAGDFVAVLGPYSSGRLDSLRIRITQVECDRLHYTDVWERDVALGDRSSQTLVLPMITLDLPRTEAQFFLGAEMCGAFIGQNDFVRLALWMDTLTTDSIKGRWRLNHQASIGDSYGYFRAGLGPNDLSIELVPLTGVAPGCPMLQLDLPIAPAINNVLLDMGTLTPNGTCFVPSAGLRFFKGAVLPPLLAPGG